MGCGCSSVDSIGIDDYITKDVLLRKSRGSEMSLDTQLRMRRIEIICMGCLEYELNPECIICRDEYIKGDVPESIRKYRPDLIFYKNVGNKKVIYHIEIDENAHKGYDNEAESVREESLRNYFNEQCDVYKLIRFNPNVLLRKGVKDDKMMMIVANQFKNIVLNADCVMKIC